ncbi:hypothetical protein PAPHI01_0921 [Pancytospora philotis]|nr:hypothetical protein PAPHI01_0921 [Pancytospora philotis]
MGFKIVAKYPLKRPPTDVAARGSRLYVSTKGKRIFFLAEGNDGLKSILFAAEVGAMSAADDALYCGCSDGRIFGLSDAHKVVFRATADPAGVTGVLYDRAREELLVSTYSKKILAFAQNSILKNTLYCYDTAVADFDVAPCGVVASVSENNQRVKLVVPGVEEPRILHLKEGFSESVRFLSNELLLVATLGGALSVYRVKTLEPVCTIKAGAGVLAMHVLKDNHVLLGCDNSTLECYRLAGRSLELVGTHEVAGLPVAFCDFRGATAVALSREPRRGRWGMSRSGKNAVCVFEFEQ